ncbi:MAG: molybdopterin-dependent oxidoreductase [Gemmatimonadales bacterium]|jgi:molybdopterin-containing oxidoreductase family iron-sulfur binding subunit
MSEIKRRDFLKILGLSGASTGLVGCAQEPAQKLIPYLVRPEEIIPGVPTYYASTCRECPAGCGVHVKVREGRPIKIEGNPDHPSNAGRLCARGQAALQGLYNPDRISGPLRRVEGGDEFESISWDEAETLLAERIDTLLQAGEGDRLFLFTDGAVGSLDTLFDAWMDAIGSPNRLICESFDVAPLREANRLTFGLAEIPRYEMQDAELILSFGAGFLETWLSPVQYARRFAASQRFHSGRKGRFIHIAPRLSLTGSNADEWVPARPGSGMLIALAMTRVLVAEGRAGSRAGAIRPMVEPFTLERVAETTGIDAERIERIAHEFADAPSSLALPPGVELADRNATAAHVAVNLLNYAAGNIGRTVRFGPNLVRRAAAGDVRLGRVAEAMQSGDAAIVMIHGCNPLHTLSPAIGMAEALDSAGYVVSFSSFMDETAAAADLILPDHTPLESWGDHVPEVGVRSLLQPTISPIFDTKQTGDILMSLASRIGDRMAARFQWPDFATYLRDAWSVVHRDVAPGQEFEEFWRESLSRGGVWREVGAQAVTLNRAVSGVVFDAPQLDGDEQTPFALLAYASPTLYDGRGANRPWLQELPDPVTKVVWNSWIEIHPETAERLGVDTGDVLEVTSPHGKLEAAACVYRGIRPDTVAMPLGQGHTRYGRWARGRGANPLSLLPAAVDETSGGRAWLTTQVGLARTGRRLDLVQTQGSDDDRGREVAEVISLAAAREAEETAREDLERSPDALVEAAEDADPKSPYRWGMVIDTSSCIGCSACVTACYAENNVPVVGEELCGQGREMAWLRIDRYYEHVIDEGEHGRAGGGHAADSREGEEAGDDFRVVHLPMLCQQCGNAPCEPVCPVYATYHNPEGLNVQVYNRCVGTRYCSNNCPYKVRRFEWFHYDFPYPLNLQLNPDVTVREKGVMEKCTFCVQRIMAARSDANAQGRDVADGDLTTACAQTCPAEAIVFGNLRDPNSRVSRLARSGRAYHVLGELNTRPAITYLKDVSRKASEEA